MGGATSPREFFKFQRGAAETCAQALRFRCVNVSDRHLQLTLTKQAKISTNFLSYAEIFAFVGFIDILTAYITVCGILMSRKESESF